MYSRGSRERHFANGVIAAFVQHERVGRQRMFRKEFGYRESRLGHTDVLLQVKGRKYHGVCRLNTCLGHLFAFERD